MPPGLTSRDAPDRVAHLHRPRQSRAASDRLLRSR
jgi:hypothetical protein